MWKGTYPLANGRGKAKARDLPTPLSPTPLSGTSGKLTNAGRQRGDVGRGDDEKTAPHSAHLLPQKTKAQRPCPWRWRSALLTFPQASLWPLDLPAVR